MKKFLMAALVWPSICMAGHPLVTDDTGTQGKAGLQLELNADAARSDLDGTISRTRQANATLTYGVTDTLDFGVTLPYQRILVGALPAEQGIGDVQAALKWRFWEQEGLSMGLTQQLTFPTGNEQRGLGNGKATYGANLIAAYEADKLTMLVNAGYTFNRNAIQARSDLWNVSAAVLWNVTPKLKAALDMGAYRNSDPSNGRNPAFAILGMIYGITEKLDIDVGFKKGLNKAEVDYAAGAGLTVRW